MVLPDLEVAATYDGFADLLGELLLFLGGLPDDLLLRFWPLSTGGLCCRRSGEADLLEVPCLADPIDINVEY